MEKILITPCDLARKALVTYAKTQTVLPFEDYALIEPGLKKAGVYVSGRHRDTNSLRFCRGTKFPLKETLEEEIIANSIYAATTEKRFSAFSFEEMDSLKLKVYILYEYTKIESLKNINPFEEALYIKSEQEKEAIVMPGLPFIASARQQFDYAVKKANIQDFQEIELFKFKIYQYQETF